MNILQKISGIFKKGRTRGYREIVSLGGQNSDWVLQSLSEDADLWQNAYALTARVRDLFKTNPIYVKLRELYWANVLGSDGHMLRMKIQETENRVITSKAEKTALFLHEERVNRVRRFAGNGILTEDQAYNAYKLADILEKRDLDSVIRAGASIQVGSPDLYANKVIEAARKEWQRKEFCDLRGARNYFQTCQLRLMGAVSDGDIFIRLIRDPGINKFGFTTQLINAEWCDRFYNDTLENGNVVIMGIEYQMTAWGIGRPVAYYFIKRVPNDWQYTTSGLFGYGASGRGIRQRIDASEIIHYARPVSAESTRPAPWVASTIPKGRQLDQYELAEVIAAREAACKTGWLYSEVNPEGGMSGVEVDPRTGLPTQPLAPGETGALPWGVKYQERNPTHPSGNFETFRKGMVRSITAGMPGADYNTLANDLENINFSAGRLGRLDTNEMSKLLQRFDIDTAERPIFEAWLEMALITGAVPLPVVKFEKFNKPNFQGRRWAQVDEVKAETASAMRIANNKSSWAIECSLDGLDFEEVVFEKAENKMLMEELGLDTTLTESKPPSAVPGADVAAGETQSSSSAAPAKKSDNAPNHEEDMTETEVRSLVRTLLDEQHSRAPVGREISASQPIHIAMPPIQNDVHVDMSKFKVQVPEQKPPVIEVKVPEQKAPHITVKAAEQPVIHVNVNPTPVEIHNNVPTTSKITVNRNSDGQMTGCDVDKS